MIEVGRVFSKTGIQDLNHKFFPIIEFLQSVNCRTTLNFLLKILQI
jgi:hypothetical protein